MSLAEYLDAAANKIAIAREYCGDLHRLREGVEHERRAVQRAFEGAISSSISAGDQVSAALAAAAGINLGRGNTPRGLLRALASPDGAHSLEQLKPCVNALRTWHEDPVVQDAHERRNLAMHAHYEKRPYKVRLTWLLEEISPWGQPSPYHGTLEIHGYCDALVATLVHLDRAIDCVRLRL